MVSDSEICYKAAEIMSERGHCKNVLETLDGRVCFNGALNAAVYGNAEQAWKAGDGSDALFNRVHDAASRIIREREGHCQHPVSYNNRLDITGEDVILLLKQTGKMLEDA